MCKNLNVIQINTNIDILVLCLGKNVIKHKKSTRLNKKVTR